MANDRLEIRAAVTSQGWGAKGGVEATEPSLKRRSLSVVPDVQGARVSIKKLPLISHRAAVIELEVLQPDVRFLPNSGHGTSAAKCPLCAKSGHGRRKPHPVQRRFRRHNICVRLGRAARPTTGRSPCRLSIHVLLGNLFL